MSYYDDYGKDIGHKDVIAKYQDDSKFISVPDQLGVENSNPLKQEDVDAQRKENNMLYPDDPALEPTYLELDAVTGPASAVAGAVAGTMKKFKGLGDSAKGLNKLAKKQTEAMNIADSMSRVDEFKAYTASKKK